MVDHEHIAELEKLGGKDAKNALASYADQFGIKLKRSKAFDVMTRDFEEAMKSLSEEPMPEVPKGAVSIFDIVEAPGETLLVDSPVVDEVETKEVTETGVVVFGQIAPAEVEIGAEDESVTPELPAPTKPQFQLPNFFSPTLHLHGTGPNAYATLPWWIYDWINQNPDWKEKPNSFPHYYGTDTIYSLIYYIRRDGYVRIRETRNSSFVILK